jgi:opacity protein-like surface antigen
MGFNQPVCPTALLVFIAGTFLFSHASAAHAGIQHPDFQPEEVESDDGGGGWLTGIRIGGHGTRIRPNGDDAEKFSNASWGGGLDVIFVPSAFHNWGALQLGFEGVVFKSEQTTLVDPDTQLRTELSTSQDLARLYVGGRLGHQGHGTIRPYVAGNAGISWYSISSTLTIPDDFDPENDVTQDLGSESDFGFGLDAMVGLEINIRNSVFLDFNVGYMKNYHIEQKISEDAIEISPEYFVARAGASFSFSGVWEKDQDKDQPETEEND